MQQRLVETVGDVRSSSESVEASASQIASGGEELNARTQRQAASLEETAAFMEQMTATVKQNANNAVEAETRARAVQTRADDGSSVARSAVAAIGEIDAFRRRITDIVGLIESIAFQTNLLALNVSVEAARAGEQAPGLCHGGQRSAQSGQSPCRRSRRDQDAGDPECGGSGHGSTCRCRRLVLLENSLGRATRG